MNCHSEQYRGFRLRLKKHSSGHWTAEAYDPFGKRTIEMIEAEGNKSSTFLHLTDCLNAMRGMLDGVAEEDAIETVEQGTAAEWKGKR